MAECVGNPPSVLDLLWTVHPPYVSPSLVRFLVVRVSCRSVLRPRRPDCRLDCLRSKGYQGFETFCGTDTRATVILFSLTRRTEILGGGDLLGTQKERELEI